MCACISFLGLLQQTATNVVANNSWISFLSQFWKSEAWSSRAGRATIPSKALGKNPCLLIPASGGSWYCLDDGSVTPISASVSNSLFHSMALYVSPFLFLINTLVIGFRPHTISDWFHLDILTLNTTTKTFIPYKVIFAGSGRHILRSRFNPF